MTQAIIAASNALHIDAVLDYFRSLKRAYVRRQAIRQTMKELNALSNRELWDIGISRCDIWNIAHDAFPADENKNLKGWV